MCHQPREQGHDYRQTHDDKDQELARRVLLPSDPPNALRRFAIGPSETWPAEMKRSTASSSASHGAAP